MIAKNSPEEVKAHTMKAAKLLSTINQTTSRANIIAAVNSALAEACKLNGVGPATGTLILSVFMPETVPFFQDETFYWITAEYDKKLKYDKKEYATVLEGVLDIVLRKGVDASDLERTVYVLSHADALDKEQKGKIEQSVDGKSRVEKPERVDFGVDESKDMSSGTDNVLVGHGTKEKPNVTKKRKQPVKDAKEESTTDQKIHADKEAPRRSKRKKNRVVDEVLT